MLDKKEPFVYRSDHPLPVDAIAESPLRRVYDYWRERCRGRAMPARADIDPTDLGPALGKVNLIDVEPGDPPAFRFRLRGSTLMVAVAAEARGRTLEELFYETGYREMLRRHYIEAVAVARPTYYRVDGTLAERPHAYTRIVLPLSEDARRVTMLLTGSWPLD